MKQQGMENHAATFLVHTNWCACFII